MEREREREQERSVSHLCTISFLISFSIHFLNLICVDHPPESSSSIVMDFRTVTISVLLFMTTAAHGPEGTVKPSELSVDNTTTTTTSLPWNTAPTAPIYRPVTAAPVQGFIKIIWTETCEGHLTFFNLSNSYFLPVCHNSSGRLQDLLTDVCQKRQGCKEKLDSPQKKKRVGYHIEYRNQTECEILVIKCKVSPAAPNVEGQLKTFKVITALLCCVLLVLFLIRFTRPTVEALQRRLSDRRQNRWIGPTQSHSVSYHRGKTAVRDNEGEKRLSYPALERLAVFDSREPSSSRNSYNL